MRNAFSQSLVEMALQDSKILLLTGDHGYSLFDDFRKKCPNQYINAGIAEQNMVSMASGLAKQGFKPVVYGLSSFIPMRVLEQIKLDICYENLPVIFIGDGAGVVYSTLGASHQCTEDISALRAIPNITILSPGDAFEMIACINLALKVKSPVYLRMGKSDLGEVWESPREFHHNGIYNINGHSENFAILATGSMLPMAKKLSRLFNCDYYSVPILKTLDADSVINHLKCNKFIVTLEEHNIMGGLGSIICEIISETTLVPILRIGINDKFSKKCGSYSFLMKEHELDLDSIIARIKKFEEDVENSS